MNCKHPEMIDSDIYENKWYCGECEKYFELQEWLPKERSLAETHTADFKPDTRCYDVGTSIAKEECGEQCEHPTGRAGGCPICPKKKPFCDICDSRGEFCRYGIDKCLCSCHQEEKEHEFEINLCGGSICKNCGQVETVPVFPPFCSGKKEKEPKPSQWREFWTGEKAHINAKLSEKIESEEPKPECDCICHGPIAGNKSCAVQCVHCCPRGYFTKEEEKEFRRELLDWLWCLCSEKSNKVGRGGFEDLRNKYL